MELLQYLDVEKQPASCLEFQRILLRYIYSTCMCVCTQLYLTLCNPMVCSHQPTLWDFPGKNIGVGCHYFLLGILTQGSNVCLLYLLHW